jgi:hypothetical protein
MTSADPDALSRQPAAFDWRGMLDTGEVLLWQGRPNAGLAFGLSHLLRILRATLMLVLFLYLLARLQTGIASYWDVRLIVLFVYFLPVPLDLVKSMITRRMQRYGLTGQRAIILTDLGPFGRMVRSYPLGSATPLTLLEGRRWSSVVFTPAPKWFTGLLTPAPEVGFQRIAGAKQVYALMRQVQKAGK